MNNQQQQTHSTEALFQPYTLGTLTLPTRIVMAPMSRMFSINGVPGEDVAAYYRRRAEKGVGLIITESTNIDHPAVISEPNIPNFYGEEALRGWAEVARQVHEVGGKIFPQFGHMGIARPAGSLPHPEAPSLAPSGLDLDGKQVTAPMTQQEIDEVIQAFVDAAVQAQKLGFDGIQVHGAHGYLIDQFFWEKTNQRTDRYGGDFIKRAQFAVEIIQKIRAEVGPDYPIAIRLSQWKMSDYQAKLFDTPEQLGQFLDVLVEAGVDIFDCSTRRFWEPAFEGSDLSLAGWVKKLTGKPTITVGSIGLDSDFTTLYTEGKGAEQKDIQALLDRLDDNEFDLVAVGRALISDPDWAIKIRENRTEELHNFTPESLTTLI
ncbi:NADH:flavin oxidoreductase [Paenibacillus sp. PK4536]|uniref:NADH:flavin oxidoreductase n=1 Tax=Paenibacillus sp. PK4536 TaxID=3024576 RepID=UPI0023592800|nr:NADH:flavin oxidoreductase [Paenibacillus sp. PK4536]WIM38289.1 NADH:flavin oxidoreductase [Paenibacillus sp. PK4536]